MWSRFVLYVIYSTTCTLGNPFEYFYHANFHLMFFHYRACHLDEPEKSFASGINLFPKKYVTCSVFWQTILTNIFEPSGRVKIRGKNVANFDIKTRRRKPEINDPAINGADCVQQEPKNSSRSSDVVFLLISCLGITYQNERKKIIALSELRCLCCKSFLLFKLPVFGDRARLWFDLLMLIMSLPVCDCH